MWEFIKHKLANFGCFFAIALVMIGMTAGTKLVLGWFHFGEAHKEALSNSMGKYVGKGLLGLLVLLGFIFMGFRLRAELRARRKPPHIPPTPPVLLHNQGRVRRPATDEDSNRKNA